MAVVDLTNENFREIYSGNDIVIIDFWAVWCGPCRAFAPVFEEVSGEFPAIIFGKVETEAEADLTSHFSVRSIPTVMAIREQLEVFYQPGALSGSDLRALVTNIQSLDMEDVRKKIDEEEAKRS